MSDPLTNTTTIQADSIQTWDPVVRRYVDLRTSVTGLAPETLNTLEKIANSLGNDSTFATFVDTQLDLKADKATTYTKTEVDASLALKSDKATTYTKTEVDASLALKANVSETHSRTYLDGIINSFDLSIASKANAVDVFSKTATESLLATKQGVFNVAQPLAFVTEPELPPLLVADVYSKAEVDGSLATKAASSFVVAELAKKSDTTYVDTQLATKANQSTTYTKAQTDALLIGKSDLASTSAALELKADKLTTYTKAETDAHFASLIGSAPEAMNTLSELAAALGDDANYAATVQTQLANKQNRFVIGEIPENTARLFDLGSTKFRAIQGGPGISVVPTNDAYLTISADSMATEAALALKADQATTYSKTEVDTSLALKANQATTYNKTEVDASLALKADKATTYSKTEVDTRLNAKADILSTYSRNIIDNKIAECQETLSVSAPDGGSALLSGNVVKGLLVTAPITLSDVAANLTIGLDTGAVVERIPNGEEFSIPLTSKFRFDTVGERVNLRRVDAATGVFSNLATFSYDPQTFQAELILNKMITIGDVECFGAMSANTLAVETSMQTPLVTATNMHVGNEVLCGTLSADAITGPAYSQIMSGAATAAANAAATATATKQDALTVLGGSAGGFDGVKLISDTTVKGLTVNAPLTLTDSGSLLTINSLSPFWVAGRVNGATVSVVSSKGRYPFMVARTSTGFFVISWTVAHPDGANFIAVASGEGGPGNAWNILHNGNTTNLANTSSSVTFIVRDNTWAAVNTTFDFLILA